MQYPIQSNPAYACHAAPDRCGGGARATADACDDHRRSRFRYLSFGGGGGEWSAGGGVSGSLGNWGASLRTHPPTAERVQALEMAAAAGLVPAVPATASATGFELLSEVSMQRINGHGLRELSCRESVQFPGGRHPLSCLLAFLPSIKSYKVHKQVLAGATQFSRE